jgi:GNAT superfamily N-acetyltransferase
VIDPIVRRAGAADVDQLLDLEVEARNELVHQRGGPRWLETHAERSASWDDFVERDRVLVATIDEAVVGYLLVGLTDTHHPTGPIVLVEEVYVTRAARELGFGDALLAAAIAWGREAGARLLEGETLPGDRDTKNLYERAGIKARMITVSTDL